MTRASTRRSATRQRLCDAAVTLIAEQGFTSTTVEQIAERAGVAKGTLYYNFGGKTDLFEEVLRQGMASLTTALEDAAAGAFASGGGAADALDAMAGAGLVFTTAHADFARLLVAEQWRPNRSWHPALAELRGGVAHVVEDVLRRGVKSGELTASLDVELTAGVLLTMVVVGALDWQTYHAARPPEEVRAAFSRILRGRLAGDGRH
ncbi:TetR/AcrR family transcriptional regulator [Streptomyces sp. SBT349]|uniref:TetR/AcrR family transcriptional regulator n=1 Tax=Streptomyces sp. SBT349 TaxID=1580539 RepID=UPI00066E702D|nr:TetR/AcrR family transcriptional regulator [Streptomyces sp. SBT349]